MSSHLVLILFVCLLLFLVLIDWFLFKHSTADEEMEEEEEEVERKYSLAADFDDEDFELWIVGHCRPQLCWTHDWMKITLKCWLRTTRTYTYTCTTSYTSFLGQSSDQKTLFISLFVAFLLFVLKTHTHTELNLLFIIFFWSTIDTFTHAFKLNSF